MTEPLSPIRLLSAASALAEMDIDHCERALAAGSSGQPLDGLAYLMRVGFWSHWDRAAARSSWPLALDVTYDELHRLARERNLLVTLPRSGDLFLSGTIRRPYGRAGIVTSVLAAGDLPTRIAWAECITLEPRLDAIAPNGDGHPRRSWRLAECYRRLSPGRRDTVIRWAELDGRAEQYDPSLVPTSPIPHRAAARIPFTLPTRLERLKGA